LNAITVRASQAAFAVNTAFGGVRGPVDNEKASRSQTQVELLGQFTPARASDPGGPAGVAARPAGRGRGVRKPLAEQEPDLHA
jgi:hypothetical protein